MELPNFSGEDKTDYGSWKAVFTSVVDHVDLPVAEKMTQLQNSLMGKSPRLDKDLGYLMTAYEREKVKLEKKYGGERRQQIKHLTTLRSWPKVRHGGISSHTQKGYGSMARLWILARSYKDKT